MMRFSSSGVCPAPSLASALAAASAAVAAAGGLATQPARCGIRARTSDKRLPDFSLAAQRALAF